MSTLSKSLCELSDAPVLLRGILVRDDTGKFVEKPGSRCFPWLPVEAFAKHVLAIDAADETTWIRGFRVWVAAERQS